MNYLHYDFDLGAQDIVQVTLDRQANVRLLDDPNFFKYTNGEQFSFFGGVAKHSPVNISAPHDGHWHLVIDLAGSSGTVNASVNIIRE